MRRQFRRGRNPYRYISAVYAITDKQNALGVAIQLTGVD
jgi:hypothetical protein